MLLKTLVNVFRCYLYRFKGSKGSFFLPSFHRLLLFGWDVSGISIFFALRLWIQVGLRGSEFRDWAEEATELGRREGLAVASFKPNQSLLRRPWRRIAMSNSPHIKRSSSQAEFSENLLQWLRPIAQAKGLSLRNFQADWQNGYVFWWPELIETIPMKDSYRRISLLMLNWS